MGRDTKQLKSKEIVSLRVIQITAIPHISILREDNDNSQDIVKRNEGGIKKLITEIYQLYKNRSNAGKANDFSFELFWKTEKVNNQTYKANVSLFLIIRAIANIESEAIAMIDEISALCISTLDYQKYDYKELLYDDFRKEVCNINNSTVNAIIKDEKFISLQNSFYPFSYSFGLFINVNLNFNKIISVLLDYPDTAISFQLIPAAFNEQEISVIDNANQNLNILSNGLINKQIGNFKVTLAEKDAFTYKYYSDHKNAPVFLHNILIYGDQFSVSNITNSISGQLSTENIVSVRSVDLTNKVNLSTNFFPQPWAINELLTHCSNCCRQSAQNPFIASYNRLPFIVTNEEAISFFKLPIASNDFSAGINVRESDKTTKVYTDKIINSGDIVIGKLRSADLKATIGFCLNDLTKHSFITGMPGSGKTTYSVGLLDTLWKKHKIPFLVIEPAKNEYRSLIQSIPDIQIFTPGKNYISPFVFNPFVPPKNVKLETYKATLKTAFSAAVSMTTPLDKIFEESIINCYSKFRWLDTYTSDDSGKVFNISDFIKCFEETFNNIGYTGDARNIGKAGIVRLQGLLSLFDNYYSIPIEDLLQKPTIIELAAIENNEEKALIIALLLLSILSYVNVNYIGNGELRNVVLLEEAHVLLDNDSNRIQGEADPSSIAKSLLKRMLAEMRAYGVGLMIADQSPRRVSADVVALTDIKIVFRLVEKSDKEIISNSTNMSENHIQRMSRLKPGEAFVFFNKLNEPEEIIAPDYRMENGISITISDDEVRKLSTYWKSNIKALRPYPQCDYCEFCKKECDYDRRVLAKQIARRIFVNQFIPNSKDPKPLFVVFSHLPEYVKDELNEEAFSKEILACVKVHLWRKIMYETEIPIFETQIINSIKKS